MAKSGSTFLALVTGAAIGAVAGLLYAPESGEKTREKLSQDAKKAQDQFNKKYQETSSNLSSKAKQAKVDFDKRLNETLSSASHKADEIISSLESKLEDLRKQNAKLQKDNSDFGTTETTRDQTTVAGTTTGNRGNQSPGKAVI